jgi:hypothetical protein
LKNGVWVVEGRPGSEVIHIEIAKKDGKVSDFYILRDPAF